MTAHQAYWLRLKITQPGLYKKLDARYRRNHKGKIRQRAREWNRDNKTRRNAQRRLRYAETKASAQAWQKPVTAIARKANPKGKTTCS